MCFQKAVLKGYELGRKVRMKEGNQNPQTMNKYDRILRHNLFFGWVKLLEKL